MNKRRMGTASALAVLMGAGLLTPQARSAPLETGDPRSAVAIARASGQRVEVTAQRTETGQVFANPSGTLTFEQHIEPVRARKGAGWAPIDTRLKVDPDSTVAPEATATPLRFSGGGTQPLVRFGTEDKQLVLSWPDALPKPALSGDSATYPEVLPGVDLRVTAEARGFTHVLVVKSAEAARNPKLTGIRFGLHGKGVAVQQGEGGVLTAVDRGRVLFRTAKPEMWDASGKRAALPVELSEGTLTLRPDRKLLTDPATRFPIEIDPHWKAGLAGWTSVLEQSPDTEYWDGANLGADKRARVGFSDWPSEEPGFPAVKFRSFFQFDTAFLHGKQVLSAQFNVLNSRSPSCQARRIVLSITDPVGPHTNWNNQPNRDDAWRIGHADYAFGYNKDCLQNWAGYDATAAARWAADTKQNTVALRLSADNERDKYAWRKFETNPQLIVEYNTRPDAPQGLQVEGKPCGIDPNEPYVGVRTPTLRATATDPDGDPVRVVFEWRTRFSPDPVGETSSPTQGSGSEFVVKMPDSFGEGSPHGTKIGLRARAFDGRDWSDWSDWCDATVDTTRPDKPPTVSSAEYPQEGWHGAVGKAGTFTFSANGVPDVVGFRYGLIHPAGTFVPAVNGTATVLITPQMMGRNVLEVFSVDKANNTNMTPALYTFKVNEGGPPVRHWPMDGSSPDTTVEETLGGRKSTFEPGAAAWTNGRISDAVRFNGGSGHVSTGDGVNTAESFAVSAWVRLDDKTTDFRTAVSQDGERGSGFYLQYIGATGRWGFAMLRSDADNAAADRVEADATSVDQGTWTHLIGVYDRPANLIKLYVNGWFAGSVARMSNWAATGKVQIGRGKFNGMATDFWPGAVDDVQVYDRVLDDQRRNAEDPVGPDSEVHNLATLPTQEQARWSFSENSGASTTDTSGRYRLGNLADGARLEPRPGHNFALALDGVRAHLSTDGPAVRTDNSFTVTAWVLPDSLADNKWITAVSQDNGRANGFYLQYHGREKAWTFGMPESDADDYAAAHAYGPAAPVAGQWTHLAGVYDASQRKALLYVNGQLVATAPVKATVKAQGPLQIGRIRYQGVYTDHWPGLIDEVRAYIGARTGHQIKEEMNAPELNAPFARAGFNRYFSHDGDHLSLTGRVAPEYKFEATLGTFAPAGTPGTVMLYSCLDNESDAFTSAREDCEGRRRLAPLGLVHTEPPPGDEATALFRCQDGIDHFDSVDPGCEGKALEARLGYLRAYAPLTRYVQYGHPGDHAATVGRVAAGYTAEGTLGGVSLVGRPGTAELFSCRSGTDEFASLDRGCEGATLVGSTGWVWVSAPKDGLELLRCKVYPTGERFLSTDPHCEGQDLDIKLGYTVSQF